MKGREVKEQWLGLHNPDWHHSVGVRAWCRCGTWCSDGAACDCCELVELRAEVETLRAQVQALRATVERWAESVEHTQCGRSGEPQCECCYDVMPVRAENDALRATIARVRETVARHQRIYAGSRDDGVPVQVILQALGGER